MADFLNDTNTTDDTAVKKRSRVANKTRVTREQKSMEADNIHEIDFDPLAFEDTGPLPQIPARQGYVQRWVRMAFGNSADARNLSTRTRRGWQPRPADTVDKAYQYMTVNNESMGGIIGTHDLVLMERPMAIHRKAEQIERDKRRNLEMAVKSNLFREHNNIGGSGSGFTAPKDESTAHVERGAPRIADDY